MKPAYALLLLNVLTAAERISPGVLLVADKKLDDPHFAKTVVVIADHSDEGTLGLILNRRSEVPLAQALEQWKEAARVNDPLFMGGPVGRTGMLALVRSKVPASGAKHIVSDIQLVADRAALAAHIAEGPGRVRVYAGYTGWGPDQLESEMSEGAWHVIPANPRLIFDDDPESLWQRLSHAVQMELAQAQPAVEYTACSNSLNNPSASLSANGSNCISRTPQILRFGSIQK